MNRHSKENVWYAATTGGLLLVFGFYLFNFDVHVDHGATYEFLLALFKFVTRVGGFVFIGIAVLCATASRVGLLIDAIASFVVGVVILLCVAGWTYFERGIDIYNIVAVIFGIMLARSGYTNLLLYRSARDQDSRDRAPMAGPPQPTVNISSSVLPKDGEPPPEEGYLAALAREKDDQANR